MKHTQHEKSLYGGGNPLNVGSNIKCQDFLMIVGREEMMEAEWRNLSKVGERNINELGWVEDRSAVLLDGRRYEAAG
jgi:hypothetical protein